MWGFKYTLNTERLRELRIQAKLSQRWIGAALGIAADRYGLWERGLATPSVQELCDVLWLFSAMLGMERLEVSAFFSCKPGPEVDINTGKPMR